MIQKYLRTEYIVINTFDTLYYTACACIQYIASSGLHMYQRISSKNEIWV